MKLIELFSNYYRTSTSFGTNLNSEEIFQDQERTPIQNMLRSRLVVEDISTNNRAELLNSMLLSYATTIADCIFKIPALKFALQNRIIFDMEKSAASKCISSKFVTCFQKTTIVSEIFPLRNCLRQPFLLKCLLAISVPTMEDGSMQFHRIPGRFNS